MSEHTMTASLAFQTTAEKTHQKVLESEKCGTANHEGVTLPCDKEDTATSHAISQGILACLELPCARSEAIRRLD
jgi:hypothetical protein